MICFFEMNKNLVYKRKKGKENCARGFFSLLKQCNSNVILQYCGENYALHFYLKL